MDKNKGKNNTTLPVCDGNIHSNLTHRIFANFGSRISNIQAIIERFVKTGNTSKSIKI